MCFLEDGKWIGPFLRDWDRMFGQATPEQRHAMLGPFGDYAAQHGNLDAPVWVPPPSPARPPAPRRKREQPVKIARQFRLDRTTVKAGERVYLQQALAAPIPPRHREIVELRLQGNTLTEIGEAYGTTKQRVNQILRRAIKAGIRNQ